MSKKTFKINNFLVEIIVPILTVFIVALLILLHQKHLVTTDPVPENVFIVPLEIAEVSSSFSIIKTGFILSGVPLVNPKDNEFVVEGFLWFEYDPARISLENISKFSVMNGDIEYKSEPKVEVRGNNLLVKYLVKIRFSSKLDYSLFPFDNHRIYFTLINRFFNPHETTYVTTKTNFVVPKNISIPGWEITGHQVVFGTSPKIESLGDLYETYPQVIFILELQKNSLGTIFTIIVPLFIMFLIALASILQTSVIRGGYGKENFNWNHYNVSIGNLAAVLAYRFVIQTLSPEVGYLTVCDYFYIFVLCAAVVSLIMPFVAIYVSYKISRIISCSLIVFLNVILIVMTYYLLFVRL